MKSDLPKGFKEGDELTADMVDGILGEIWRWRRVQAMSPLHVSEADSDAPPVFSFFKNIEQTFPGTTGGGYAAGTPASPTAVTTSCTIYTTETPTGWTGSKTVTNAYNIYSGTIAADKTAWYWQSPTTGNYYILTADC